MGDEERSECGGKRRAAALMRVVYAAVALCCVSAASMAQTNADPRADAEGADPPDRAPAGEVEFVSTGAGLGGVVVPGDWAGFPLRVRSLGGEPARNVALRLHVEDVDGDTALYERDVTLTRSLERDAWLYAPVPYGATGGSAMLLTAHAVDPDTGDTGRLIGSDRVVLRNVADSSAALIGVVGSSAMGLEQYELPHPLATSERVGSSHRVRDVVRGILPGDFPDRWMGLASHATIVWGERSPDTLSDAQAAALAEWVRRGGHLVVVLPAVSDVWQDASANPLSELMPRVEIARRERVDLEPYRNLLTRPEYDAFPLPGDTTLHTVEPLDDARPAEAGCVISGPEGCVVAKGAAGSGSVTVVGLPLWDPALRGAGVLRADALWHRILGERFEIPSPRQTADREFLNKVAREAQVGEPAFVDEFIPAAIGRSGAAAAGVLLALIVFISYWLLAGPLGFAILKRRGDQRHAWVAFVATTAAFAAVAWAGAQAISPRTASVTHLTIVDHVYDQPVHRNRSWATVLMPSYGDRAIALREPDLSRGQARNAMFAWADPQADSSLRFPDARAYAVPAAEPDSFTVPARGTVKQFRADWLGPARFATPGPVLGNEPALRPDGSMTGALTHAMRAPLLDAKVYVCRGQRGELAVRRSLEGQPANEDFGPARSEIHVYSLAGPWEAGQAFDLASLDRPSARTLISTQIGGSGSSDIGSVHRLSFGSVIPQPDFFDTRTRLARGAPRYRSRLAPTMDLSHWMTRPCLIIIGRIDASDMPEGDRSSLFVTPSAQDGEPGRAIPVEEGTVVLRWVYPLAGPPADFAGRR